MRYLRYVIGLVLYLTLLADVPAQAITTVPSDGQQVNIDSPFIVTAHSTTAHRLNYVQLYNTDSVVRSLDGWKLYYTVSPQEVEVAVTLGGMVSPGGSVIVADSETVPTAIFQYAAPEVDTLDTLRITALRLAAPAGSGFFDHVVQPAYPSSSVATDTLYAARNRSTSTGNYLSSFTMSATQPSQLTQDELYDPPLSTPIRVVEVLANPRTCSPLEQFGDCRDYVKLYNPTDLPIDLSTYRIRTGHEGQSSTSSNTVQLGGELAPRTYAAYEVGVTNGGSWVWLEDTYGVIRYDDTVIEYPDASSDKRKGHSWALGVEGWSWASPQPTGANVLLSEEEVEEVVDAGLVPCAADQYRSPETNRCRKIETATEPASCRSDQYRSPETNRCRNIATATAPAPCDADEYRNPETNRCRKLTTASSGIAPCKEGQYRSPETNRCRSLAAASAQLKPCAANQERNPETNRCRKVLSGDGDVGFAVVDSPSMSGHRWSWLALGGVGFASLGYAAWEWRREMRNALTKVLGLLPFVK